MWNYLKASIPGAFPHETTSSVNGLEPYETTSLDTEISTPIPVHQSEVEARNIRTVVDRRHHTISTWYDNHCTFCCLGDANFSKLPP